MGVRVCRVTRRMVGWIEASAVGGKHGLELSCARTRAVVSRELFSWDGFCSQKVLLSGRTYRTYGATHTPYGRRYAATGVGG